MSSSPWNLLPWPFFFSKNRTLYYPKKWPHLVDAINPLLNALQSFLQCISFTFKYFGAVKKYRATMPVTEFVSVLPVIPSSGRKSFYMIRNIGLMYKVVFVLLRGVIAVILGWAQSFPLNARGGVWQDEGYLQGGAGRELLSLLEGQMTELRLLL